MTTTTSPVDESRRPGCASSDCRTCAPRRRSCWPLARAQRWDPAEAMRALLAEELAGRQASSIRARRKAAGFPTGKTFEAWDETVSSIPAPTQRALRTLEWIHRRENLVVCGPSGTGKTHFCEALGQAAVDAGCKVAWFSLEHLGALVRRHSADDTAAKAINKIMRADIIVIDDIGLLPGRSRHRGGALPRRRRRLREALHRAVEQPAPRRLRRAHAPRPSPTPPSTGCCTTPTLCSPPATASASPKPPPERGVTPLTN